MKRILISLTLASCIFLAGCGNKIVYTSDLPEYADAEIGIRNFSNKLVIDKNTHVVYIQISGGYAGYLSPYISPNGNYYKYENGKIVEIIED